MNCCYTKRKKKDNAEKNVLQQFVKTKIMHTGNNLAATAILLFKSWASNALQKYPLLNLQLTEYTPLENDLKMALSKAKWSLAKEENTDKRNKRGYDYSYICGHVEGYLNVHWNHEYIAKQSDTYKTLIALQTLQTYFKFNKVLALQLNSAYAEQYKQSVNVDCTDSSIKLTLPEEINFIKDIDEHYETSIETAIASVINKYIAEITNSNNDVFLPGLVDYFTEDEIDAFLNDSVFFT